MIDDDAEATPESDALNFFPLNEAVLIFAVSAAGGAQIILDTEDKTLLPVFLHKLEIAIKQLKAYMPQLTAH